MKRILVVDDDKPVYGKRDRAMGAGYDGYIETPINPDTFASGVGRCLQ